MIANMMYRYTGARESATVFFKDKNIGDFNDFPPNLTKITEAELVSKTHIGFQTPVYVEGRQVCIDGYYRLLNLYWFWDYTGYAYYIDSRKPGITWFKFAICEHKFETLPSAMFERHERCVKCGFEQRFDTSG